MHNDNGNRYLVCIDGVPLSAEPLTAEDAMAHFIDQDALDDNGAVEVRTFSEQLAAGTHY